jgi:sulfofructose kinase
VTTTLSSTGSISPRILGIGFACVDDLLLLSEIPPPEGRATIRGRLEQGGGMVATAMVAIARLGGNASFITRVGDDPTGAQILDEFRAERVDVSHSITSSGFTSHRTIVLVDGRSGARAFLAGRGTANDVMPDDLDIEWVAASPFLHLSDAGPAAVAAAQAVQEAGGRACLDGTHYHPSVDALLPHLEYLVVSRFFASEYRAHIDGRDLGAAAREYAATLAARDQSPHPNPAAMSDSYAPVLAGRKLLETAKLLRERGPKVVVVTEGESGCWCASPDGDFHVPAYVAPQVVDTTGAGDVFHGAFLQAQATGHNLHASLEMASAVAALKCRALGGRTGSPNLQTTLAFMASAQRHT